MKAQATIELMAIFLIVIAMVSLITQSLLQAHGQMAEKSAGAMERAKVENEILAQEIMCNSNKAAPEDVVYQANVRRQTGKWIIKIDQNGSEFVFPGIFKGCEDGYGKNLV